ncbi:MAG: NgoBV family restriction endonuclease [Blautia wexlerae]
MNIIVKQRDVVEISCRNGCKVGRIKRGIEYAPSENTQMPPDFS